ncbi:MAG: ABC transporter substrate-binding protein, partial [Chloroflexota bacterium]
MNPKLRLLAVGVLTSLALTVPALAQDATPEVMMTGADGMITYAAPNCDYGGEFAAMQAVDASTVKFTLCFPDGAFPQKVAFSAFQIHSYAQLQATGGGGDLNTHPMGTGPWKFDHWDQGSEVV